MSPKQDTFFCDTSVLVAASDVAHEHHARSLALISTATPSLAFCAAHSLAELYSTLSGGRYLRTIPLAQIPQLVHRVRKLFTVVNITDDDYLTILDRAVLQQTRGGRIYDALHVYAAEQCKAKVIYTWNEKDFRAVATAEFSKRIRTP